MIPNESIYVMGWQYKADHENKRVFCRPTEGDEREPSCGTYEQVMDYVREFGIQPKKQKHDPCES